MTMEKAKDWGYHKTFDKRGGKNACRGKWINGWGRKWRVACVVFVTEVSWLKWSESEVERKDKERFEVISDS